MTHYGGKVNSHKHNIRYIMTAVLAAGMFLPYHLNAQIEKKDTTSLRTVHVTAQRRLRDTGLQRTMLDSLILHENISRSMSEILTQNSTAFIKSYGRATESTAEFRGTSPSHTQVLWNGMRINSPMLGTMDFSTIPGCFMDKATLYHGASSIPLTGGGLGGAVELASLPTEQQGWGTQFIQGIGSYKTTDDFLRLTYGWGRWNSSTRVAYGRSDNDFTYTNYDKMVDERDANGNIVKSYHPQEKNRSGYFHDLHIMQDLQWRDGRGNRVTASAWYAKTLRGLPFLSVDYKDDQDFHNEQDFQTLRATTGWEHTATQCTTTLRGGLSLQDMAYEYYTTRREFRTDITHSRSHTHSGFLETEGNWMPSGQWLLTATASAYLNHVRSQDRSPYHIGDNYNRSRAEESLTLQARWRPIEKFTLAAVLREEVYGQTVSKPVPALFADVLLLPSWGLTLKSSVARNYRFPSMNDLFFQPGSNPELGPESGFTYDGGLAMDKKWSRVRLKGSLTSFDSYIHDWIQWLPNAKGYWEPSNIKRVHSFGFETSWQANLQLGKDCHILLRTNL